MANSVQILDSRGVPMASSARRASGRDSYHLAASYMAPELADILRQDTAIDAILHSEREDIAAAARDLQRNDPTIKSAVENYKNRMVGAGLQLQSMPDYDSLGIDREAAQEIAKKIEELWHEFSEDALACDVTGQSTFAQLDRIAAEQEMVGGESITLMLWEPQRQARLGSRWATTLQQVNASRLSNPNFAQSDIRFRDGVEIDRFGMPMMYHFVQPQGDMLQNLRYLGGEWDRVHARHPRTGWQQVIHSYDKTAPGQHRGLSMLAAILIPALQRMRAIRATQSAMVASAIIAFALETNLDFTEEDIKGIFADDDGETANPNIRLGMGPGARVPVLPPGMSLNSHTPGQPGPNMAEFIGVIDRIIARGVGDTYESHTGDFSQTNFASAKGSLGVAQQYTHAHRPLRAIRFCMPLYERVMLEAVAREYIELPGFLSSRSRRRAWLRASWIGPGSPILDPVKEIQAAALRIKARLSTHRAEAAKLGLDWDQLVEQLKVEAERLGIEPNALFADASFTPQPDTPEDQPPAKK